MSELPDVLIRGERSRLFPVLADTSKEGRTLSILLACIESVEEFGRALVSELGIKIGSRSKLETYTEVVLKRGIDKPHRPDGLIIVSGGGKTWKALVEAKVGNSDVTIEQLDAYLEIAKINNIDALITISNVYAPLPSHYPTQLSAASLKKASIFHWSLMHILTQATLHLNNGEVSDREQRIILNEMVRFLSHASAGVRSFDQMPQAWNEITATVQSGASVSPRSLGTLDVVGAWYQEICDLALILSRQLGEEVQLKVPRAHVIEPSARMKADAETLATKNCLMATYKIPNTAGDVSVVADIHKRSIFVSMRLGAPADRKSTRARVSWLLRQLQKSNADGIFIRLFWPGRGSFTQHALSLLRDAPERAEESGKVVTSFEVVYVRDLATRFAQRRNFIADLEQIVPVFYDQVGQHLKVWQPPAPTLKEELRDPSEVSTEALQEEAEEIASNRAIPSST